MDIDPFEARIKFLGLLQSMNASQQSLQRVSSFALKYHALHQDLCSCIVEELEQTASVNARMNILYLIDTLIDAASSSITSKAAAAYISFVKKEMLTLIALVAPPGQMGIPNLAPAKKLLEQWKARNAFQNDTSSIDEALRLLVEGREDEVMQSLAHASQQADSTKRKKQGDVVAFSRQDILRRMDEDRERHKRSREQLWVLPNNLPREDLVDLEFERAWETTSDLNDDDRELMLEECRKQRPDYPWQQVSNSNENA